MTRFVTDSRASKKLNEGDIITVDMVVNYRGALADSAWTYAVGEVPDDVKHLMDVTHKALYLGIEQAQVGARVGDIGHAIQTYVESENLAVVREFIGHGVGPTLHENQISHITVQLAKDLA